jgi:WD40 repeat protein
MTRFERFEHAVPSLMTELAPARIPDYFESMLQETAKHRQRPAWSYLERWLPMGVLARTVPMRPLSWRPILVLALIGLLIAAGLAIYIGSRATRLPPPFGIARNGDLLVSTTDGDIVSLDPATGRTTTVLSGPDHEEGASFSPDGRRIMFGRGGPTIGLYVANSDGTNVRRLMEDWSGLTWIDWSQSGDRIVATGVDVAGEAVTLVIDPTDGAAQTLRLGHRFDQVIGRFGTGQLVLTEFTGPREAGGAPHYWIADADGTDLRRLATSLNAINEASLSPDGSKLAYATWGGGSGVGERIHVLDIDAGTEWLATPDVADGFLWQDAVFSPDGTRILTKRFEPGTYSYRVAVIPADGVGRVVLVGDVKSSTEVHVDPVFSPDGTKILVRYEEPKELWLFDAASGEGTQLPAPPTDLASWQRLAP